jgi:membrane-bound lytic murein transglycosylase B
MHSLRATLSTGTRRLLVSGSCALALLITGMTTVHAGEYEQREDVIAFANQMQEKYGIKQADILATLAKAEKKQKILDAIAKPAEKAKPWKEYRTIFITDARIQGGVEFWLANEKNLKIAAEQYQVEPQMIVAIIGVETSYGKNTGSYRVLDALSTLAFDYPPRQKFFRQELENFFVLTRDQKQDPLSLTGSYAGAMGYGQFMPSSYRNFAVDSDGDGFADIWKNRADAIASVANYFRKHGWKSGEPVIARAHVTADFNTALLGTDFKPQATLLDLASAGVAPVVGGLDVNRKAVLLKQEGDYGTEYWLGFDNFYTITRYNNSSMYAMAAYQLAEAIKSQHNLRQKQSSQTAPD